MLQQWKVEDEQEIVHIDPCSTAVTVTESDLYLPVESQVTISLPPLSSKCLLTTSLTQPVPYMDKIILRLWDTVRGVVHAPNTRYLTVLNRT